MSNAASAKNPTMNEPSRSNDSDPLTICSIVATS